MMTSHIATRYISIVLIFLAYKSANANGSPQFRIDAGSPFIPGVNLRGADRWFHMRFVDKIVKMMPFNDTFPWHLECVACKMGTKMFQYVIHLGAKEDTIVALAGVICRKFHLAVDEVCDGIVHAYKDEVIKVFSQVSVNASEFCSTIVDKDCGISPTSKENWTVELPDIPKPPVIPVKPPKEGSPVLRVLQLSDIHYDPEYLVGSYANCGEPLCCRATSRKSSSATVAGSWGDYGGCDTPLQTLENALQHISKNHQIDYILWTGDDPPHNVWNQQKEMHIKIITKVAKLLLTYFPGIPILPTLGNHEGIPTNSFPPPFASTSMEWLYDTLGDLWSTWLPPQANITILKGGFYSIPLFPGFRIISLNMNFCNNLNLWLLLNSTDPLNELQWLVDLLADAEALGEKVHIIGHIPPGTSDCLPRWSYNYNRIVNRYESTIRSQFFGHTHMDEFEVFYNSSEINKRPISMAYIGASVTPWSKTNPSYRIYTVDGNYTNSTWAVLDHDTYYFDLIEANQRGAPLWKHLYSAKDAYNLTSLQPEEWDDFITKIENNDDVFQKFYRNYRSDSSAMPPCDEVCKKKILCDLKNSWSYGNIICYSKVDA